MIYFQFEMDYEWIMNGLWMDYEWTMNGILFSVINVPTEQNNWKYWNWKKQLKLYSTWASKLEIINFLFAF